MSVNIAICDDNLEDMKTLLEALYAYDSSFQISIYSDGQQFLEDWSEHKVLFDILFLDINIPVVNGIDIARKIQRGSTDLKIIFVSFSNKHYSEAYEVFAFNYIIKPVNSKKLNYILDKALNDIAKVRRKQICFSYKNSKFRIYCDNIMYIESRDKTIYFHMKDKRTLKCYSKLTFVLQQLPNEYFVRCHQSFAVNIFYVTEMTDKYFCLDKIVINISKKYQKTAKDKYLEYPFHAIEN
jgi:DNA-binding LytR/AlgR family response regulator